MKPEFKQKVLDLLSKETQTSGALHKTINTNICFCIEGIFALALGGQPVDEYQGFILDTVLETGYLNQNKFIENEIEPDVNIEWILENRVDLNLTGEQISQLQERHYSVIKWRYLNDEIKLTFEQFAKLISLL